MCRKECFEVMEMLFIIIVGVTTQLYTLVKTLELQRVTSTIGILYFNSPDRKYLQKQCILLL
jgi:hypothetical protein